MQYLIATIVVFSVGMLSVVLVTLLRVTEDNGILITAIIGFTGTTLGSVLAFMKSQETHASVNSRMDDFIKKFEASSVAKQDLARSEGLAEGKTQGRKSSDDRTDTLSGLAGLSTRQADVELKDPLREIERNTKETAEVLKEIKDK